MYIHIKDCACMRACGCRHICKFKYACLCDQAKIKVYMFMHARGCGSEICDVYTYINVHLENTKK